MTSLSAASYIRMLIFLQRHHLQGDGLPADMFLVLFAIGRALSWLAQWVESIDDKDQKIACPRQIYLALELGLRPDERPQLVVG